MAERALTDLQLERVIAGDKQLDARATDADRARLEELRTQSAAYLAAVDVDAEVRRIAQRAEAHRPPKRAWLRWVAPMGALAAAAAVVLVLVRRPANDDDFQTKGDIALVIHAASGARLQSGDSVAPGERIRFEVSGTRKGYVAVIGIDGAGMRTIYYPFGASTAAAIGSERLLPGAIALDATPGDEHFIAVFSPHPFALDPLPADVAKSEIVLHKK